MSDRRGWRVHLPDGSSRRIDRRGLVVGRGFDADIVVPHARASRQHVLIRVAPTGPQAVPLTPAPTWVDGEPITTTTMLVDGCRLAMPGLELRVRTSSDDPTTAPVWVLERESGALLGVPESGISVGGDPTDDVVVDGWPAAALRLYIVGGRLSVANAVEVEIDGRHVEPDGLEPLERGARLEVCGESLHVLGGGTRVSERTTAEPSISAHPTLPHRVRLSFRPRGGELEVVVGSRQYRVELPERRCELVACLLRPQGRLKAGQMVRDEEIGGRLWPQRAVVRTDLNVLVHRLRRDLTAAGLDGARLIERARGGHATRFCLAPEAVVRLD
ncbi:MAG: FHA domain-containing protein [Deltaproteobacteria bacterium]|nr:FHA domain-containing protein [Deltaproteobacteria bacterium]